METFKNPILPGFYPDPSICRVGDDYYLVTSTFEYFPGVPIFHSKDLVHWNQLGHVLDRSSQLNLDETPCSCGIYAPTLRYHEGIFYMITTFVVTRTGERKNFYVTATDPEGPWSDPYWLQSAPGIDPSLFFDDDGKCYYTGNRVPAGGEQYPKQREIWLQELDLDKQELVGEKIVLWDGAVKQAIAPEGPHIYKVEGKYYLLIAEGGTSFTHSVTISRSKSIKGPYEPSMTNPILTHRHLGKGYPISNVGHGDIVQTQYGEWWMVCLGSRPYGGDFRNLGRETFLVPFTWEDGWPVINPGKGMIELEMPKPKLKERKWSLSPACDHFDKEKLSHIWNFVRTPRGDYWSLKERPGFLRLKLKPETIMEPSNASFIGRRQQHKNFVVRTLMEFTPLEEWESAGVILLQSSQYQLRLECRLQNNNKVVQLIRRSDGREETLQEHPLNVSKIFIKIEAVGQQYSFYYGEKSEEWNTFIENVDGSILSTDIAGGFVGTYIGMYASSNGQTSDHYVDFDWFEYVGDPYEQ
ncbi:glycoside hydrolase family 43 protein [Evansella sp. AB-P1]|uniref:glycoside hydrolase family 43 protein n=1 Tax=Evansella sp. AB-P1 TaxID=3037653 RepID=UPI00241D61A7|nr:glycoside hydrolase family 43 protein [Evansella sp. AB-P1]MDG5787859.1 glycoside hydrolase family 43 protein [Evansella sp. AB-P1]